jgi:dTDP-4-amino-4,6-dideoxygalactose transaminase
LIFAKKYVISLEKNPNILIFTPFLNIQTSFHSMKKIQMVDLVSQYAKIKPQVDLAIQEVLHTAQFINGNYVQQFKTDLAAYLGVKHVIPCANGTDALQIALMALGLKKGDEIITPSFTYIATTEVIALLGLTPVFVEVNPDDFCMNIESLQKAITTKTKAIVPVHLYGQAANMEAILKIAKENNLFVVEDNAQAIGCDYTLSDGTKKKTGTMGDIGATSFFPSKNLGCYGDGGAIFTNDDNLAAQMQMIANHGQSKRYYHDVVGCNSRLDNIQAAVLCVKLKELDAYSYARNKVARYYDERLAKIKGITVPFRTSYSNHVFHQYTLKLEGINREKLIDYLAGKGIPSMIYYPVPGHRQQMFASFNLKSIELPVTDNLTERVMSLPIHTEMDDEQLDYICAAIESFVN